MQEVTPMKKRILGMLLVLLITVCIAPVPVLADRWPIDESGPCGPMYSQESVTYHYYSRSGKLEITATANEPIGFSPWTRGPLIAESIEALSIWIGITGICDDAFNGCRNLTTFNYTASGSGWVFNMEKIGNRAFKDCTKYDVSNIFMGDTVKEIGAEAFRNCDALVFMTLPNSVETIGANVFSDCDRLTTLTLSNNIKHIPDFMISNCPDLEQITLPANLESIGGQPFVNCPKLTTVNISSNNPYYSTENGVLFNKDKTVLIACPNSKESYTVPSSVTSIQNGAFHNCTNLKSITIPGEGTVINEFAFSNCSSLESVTVSGNGAQIKGNAFAGCTSLKNLTITGNE